MKNPGFGLSMRLLASRRFGTFWFASLLSNIGTWAQQVAQPWLLLSLGASPFLIGLDAFALGAPGWLLTIVGGVLADRADRRRVITIFQSIQMLCPTLIVVLLLAGRVQPWIVIAMSLIVGITDALSMPSFQSIVPSIVKPNQIAAGLALNSTQFNLSRILGPALAGILLAGVGTVACFAVSALSYVPFILVALWILPRRARSHAVQLPGGWRALVANLRAIAGMRRVGGVLLTVFFSSLLCAQLVTFSPVLVRDALGGDAGHFSIAVGAFGVGGLAGALALLFMRAGRDRQPVVAGFAIAYGLVLVAVSFVPSVSWLAALCVAGGVAMSVSNIAANTIVQTEIAADLRGEAVSLYMLAMRGGLSVGSLATGISVGLLGVRHALLVNGVLAIAVQLLIGLLLFRGRRATASASPSHV